MRESTRRSRAEADSVHRSCNLPHRRSCAMIRAELDESTGVLYVTPPAPLAEMDFDKLAATDDPYIDKNGHLSGLLLQIDHFPGWENLSAMVHHFRFVRDHHKKISKIAVVTDAPVGKIAE